MEVQCCIAGGGPAGMMLGFLLARSGVRVAVLEKHADFLRDFRGDTVHPSTLEAIYELGLLSDFLNRPHQEAHQLTGYIEDEPIAIADFDRLSTKCKFIALMPQWDFLNFLSDHGREYPGFHLLMETKVTGLIEEKNKVVGVKAQSPEGEIQIRAQLVIGADGRHSTVRELAGLTVENLGAPIDVLWMRITRKSSDPSQLLGRIQSGRILAMIDRGTYWQCGLVIRKGQFEELKKQNIETFHKTLAEVAPFLADRVNELITWNDIKLLTVTVDRLKNWYKDGLLCIGDSAHAMSPIGGVGINLAIQDAIATANILHQKLREGNVSEADLARVQRRRTFPTKMTQSAQILIQNRVMGSVLGSQRKISIPFPMRLLQKISLLRTIPAYLVGVGIRPEHIATPDIKVIDSQP